MARKPFEFDSSTQGIVVFHPDGRVTDRSGWGRRAHEVHEVQVEMEQRQQRAEAERNRREEQNRRR